jgi:hypothetical protein
MPAPTSRTCWPIRAPSLETKAVRVSQACDSASAIATPAARIVAVTPVSRSPFSASGTAKGSSRHSLAQPPCTAGTPTSSTSGPGTAAEARAMAVARPPVRRASPSPVGSPTAAKPHEEPTSARTPRPADVVWLSDRMSPSRAVVDSCRRSTSRASAYRAPAASAASTAVAAASNAADGTVSGMS